MTQLFPFAPVKTSIPLNFLHRQETQELWRDWCSFWNLSRQEKLSLYTLLVSFPSITHDCTFVTVCCVTHVTSTGSSPPTWSSMTVNRNGKQLERQLLSFSTTAEPSFTPTLSQAWGGQNWMGYTKSHGSSVSLFLHSWIVILSCRSCHGHMVRGLVGIQHQACLFLHISFFYCEPKSSLQKSLQKCVLPSEPCDGRREPHAIS